MYSQNCKKVVRISRNSPKIWWSGWFEKIFLNFWNEITAQKVGPIIPGSSENRKWVNGVLFFVNCNFSTLLVRIMSPESFFDVKFFTISLLIIILSHYSDSSMSHRPSVLFFWGWYSQILTLTERGKGKDIKREETISSISLPYSVFVLLQRSKNQRRRKAQKFKRKITKKFLWKFLRKPFENLRAVQWIAAKGKISFWWKKCNFWEKNKQNVVILDKNGYFWCEKLLFWEKWRYSATKNVYLMWNSAIVCFENFQNSNFWPKYPFLPYVFIFRHFSLIFEATNSILVWQRMLIKHMACPPVLVNLRVANCYIWQSLKYCHRIKLLPSYS